MNINKFLRLLKQARVEHGYEFELGEGLRIVPEDEPEPRFTVVTTMSIVHHDPDIDIRIFFPAEAIWHCFYRKDDEEHLPGPGKAFEVLGVNHRRMHLIMGAGCERHGHDKKLRRLMLKAAGLREVPMEERRVPSNAKSRKPAGRRASKRKRRPEKEGRQC